MQFAPHGEPAKRTTCAVFSLFMRDLVLCHFYYFANFAHYKNRKKKKKTLNQQQRKKREISIAQAAAMLVMEDLSSFKTK